MLSQRLRVLPIPTWLDSLTSTTMEREPLPLVDILRESLYYPASGIDGTPIKYFAGHFLSFIFVIVWDQDR